METSSSYDLLLIILSTGFVILIIFVCVALGAMIKIMLDIKKITEIAKKESEKIDGIIDSIGNKAKSMLTNSLVLEKVLPSIIGAISVAFGAKNAMDHYDSKVNVSSKKSKKRGSRIFTKEEID